MAFTDASLVALRVFREVAERGTLTAAATALGYTQSAVSRQIAALERAAGASLLERRHDGVRLTAAGRLVLRHAAVVRSEEHTSELQSQSNLVCRLLLEKKKKIVCMILL